MKLPIKPHNQEGITLVELLVTLALLTIVSTIIISLITNSHNNMQSIYSKNQARTHANQILYQLTDIHQTRKVYTFPIEEKDSFTLTDGNGMKAEVPIPGYAYQVTSIKDVNGNTLPSNSGRIRIDLTNPNHLTIHIKLKISPIESGDYRFVEIDTSISRLSIANKGGGET